MQFLCIAALLLAAAAAHPESPKPWQDKSFPPSGGPELDFQPGEDEQAIKSLEDGVAGSGGDSPEWSHEMTTGLPNRPGRPQASYRGRRQAPDFDTDVPGVPRPGPGRPFGRHRGRGRGPNSRNPAARGNVAFSSIFKINNVPFQNATNVPLKEGENIFLLLKHGRRGPHHHAGGKHRHPKNEQYLKLIYNATMPNVVSIEYGVLKPINLEKLFGEEGNNLGDY